MHDFTVAYVEPLTDDISHFFEVGFNVVGAVEKDDIPPEFMIGEPGYDWNNTTAVRKSFYRCLENNAGPFTEAVKKHVPMRRVLKALRMVAHSGALTDKCVRLDFAFDS